MPTRMDSPSSSNERDMTCIQCPKGCSLHARSRGNAVEVKGNQCPKGRDYALREITNPSRTLTTTVATIFNDCPRVPVRTGADIPLAVVFEAMAAINGVHADRRLRPGDVLIPDLLGTGVPVIATGDMTAFGKGF